MKDITQNFGKLYHPVKAFVIYQENTDKNVYVESYDMDKNGSAINAHPLSLRESTALSKALDTTQKSKRNFLKSRGLLPKNVIYVNSSSNGFAIWHTPAQRVELFFVEQLGISNGRASIPPLLWKASKTALWVYAMKMDSDKDISEETLLCHAPFFNLYNDGKVCMGTVKINIEPDAHLQYFIGIWQKYFFNSYFSHLIGQKSPVKGNLIALWQKLINSKKQFPVKSLLRNGLTIKKLLS
ncbi:PRTRC genetic system protein B [Flavobacterium sp. 90]|uniref:PRTRC system protein B n=1 Tax=unclassified Flavobacterium TaxID=196869 RepID=UPI000EB1E12F|nr:MULTISPECIES: PRTRC system protein B [unclassified Flavobacterium]RKR05129.1 PRTRC genetic system protein B [Flavobacterium sp. 81]TCK56444.1 PRTRC genetic system protein B [Flavobacterium sp. 90]